MTDHMQTTILVTLVSGLLLILLSIIGFAVRRWVSHVDGLQQAMEALRESIVGLSDKFVTHAQHERDLEQIRALGRRTSDRCTAPECPYETRR